MDPDLIRRYESRQGASSYRTKYDRSLARRLSNRRELKIVDRALTRAGAAGRLLDCPCGAGRLTPTLLRHGDHVTAVDLSAAMVDEARDALQELADAGRVDFAVASVDALPFEDDSFDTAVSHRLIHHVADAEERAGMLRELRRVAQRRVVLSFNDATTFKMRWQARRGKTRRRIAMKPHELRAEAHEQGLYMDGDVLRLNGLFSLVAIAVFRLDEETTA